MAYDQQTDVVSGEEYRYALTNFVSQSRVEQSTNLTRYLSV
jgi:hypothetical protein